jgi:putative PEP-CTERM system histidine kinase
MNTAVIAVFSTVLAAAGATLVRVLLVSEKLRSQTRRFLSRHFERPQYDYRRVWRAFTEGTARHLELTDLCRAVAKLVSELFDVRSVTIWLLDERHEKLAFGASTGLCKAQAESLRLQSAEAAEVISGLREHPEPMDAGPSGAKWAMALQRLHAFEEAEGGTLICAPLLVRGEVLGVMILGERAAGAAYSIQDIDLLKAVSDQAAASLLNLQLAQRLSQARQLEAFQSMSTFFVHDLKNTASTLSLMLENLPVHFNDPVFRADALRGITNTVTHINELIGRLRLLRETLGLKTVESDFNELVQEALKGLEDARPAEMVKELRPLPKVQVDPEQIRNVVANLVLNARDAIGAKGRIRVETSQRNGWVVLGVADSGCGMSRDFMQRLLFRPFQTTKKNGFGIGMFQCKMIVEAHRGKIEVESEVGKGTAFRVLLPALETQAA